MTAVARGVADEADRIRAVGIVVPARDEERLLPRCLDALGTAISRLGVERPDVLVRVVVVLDTCTDRTRQVADACPFVMAVSVEVACVGAARAVGADHVARAHGMHPDNLWLLTTDADSAVPADWLTSHVELAESGFDAVVGTVEPDQADLSADVLGRWRSQHRLVLGHRHVHGANLGMRFSAYAAAAGFETLLTHEDVRLVRRLRRNGARILATPHFPVLTSGRTEARAPGGFAAYLSALVEGPTQGHV